ncbi:MAG TPA: hypothetical protein VFP37_04315 [Steroidobacteraceae bacterium]|nr:hypothetical protein [Steroidobacteraceae bacterium]
MRNLLFSVFAIGVAAVAAMTATTAMLNAPQRTAAAEVITQNIQPDDTRDAAPASQPATSKDEDAPPAKPGGTPDSAAKPAADAGGADKNDTAAAEPEGDKDPYEGIAPEELPPDLQYSADSSVSFPTNI